jgi:hypothetical protein
MPSEMPVHLNSRLRETLVHIFQHPLNHNIEWHAVLALLEVVGTVEERRDGKLAVTLGSRTQFFERPRHKDVDAEMVVALRRMLSDTGYRPEDQGSRADTHKPEGGG